jgi:hypothetical protein
MGSSARIFAVRAVVFWLRGATECEVGLKGFSTSGTKYNLIENKEENFLVHTRQNPQPIRSG